jgi:hypothetical protein
MRESAMSKAVNIPREDLHVFLDRQSHVALPFRRDKKRIDFIAYDGAGPQHMFCSIPDFEMTYVKVYEQHPLEDSVLSFLRGVKRAFLPGEGIADTLLEIFNMITIEGKELKDCTVKELVAYYNQLHKAAGNPGTITEKTFKTKGLLMEAIDAMALHAVAKTPDQVANQNETREKAADRLSGLDKKKEEKAQQAEDAAEVAATKKKPGRTLPGVTPGPTAAADAKAAKNLANKIAASKPEPKKAGKPAAKAASKPMAKPAASKPRGQGIGAFCMDLIIKKKSNEEVLAAVAKQFPGASTSNSCINWYRNKLKKEGK